ncbi:DUF4296 domain-containing protein [Winogradskyella litoriviva]|uniref:DUF4296 domain-containing protein n=1 Tax=Winogradskyella litoriviva TaxID=1220182 RepID=A0ABX2E2D2_9FLAO|nr:DUF4296 domain-containing protein [Winogradskyella litoriviva]NRD21911.1 DUF4296 domain-containing protein [Winogradskyella litoriviva]
MLKHLGIILVLGILLIACDNLDKPKKPDNLIPKAQMTELLYDVYMVNAAKGVNRKTLELHGIIPQDYILSKHNIDSLQFAESNTYYSFETDVYKSIVDKVKARLEKEKEEYEAIRIEESENKQKQNDSLREKAKKQKDSIKRLINKKGFVGG